MANALSLDLQTLADIWQPVTSSVFCLKSILQQEQLTSVSSSLEIHFHLGIQHLYIDYRALY